MTLEFAITTTLPASPEDVYGAWLDSAAHSAMTGSKAEVSDQVGAEFSAWDGYISGRNLELEPGRRIVQAWRTVEFTEAEGDSRLEIDLKPVEAGTKLTLRHSELPEHGEQYRQGWEDNYFEPMKAYFT
jgi:activator of HSP90 ATPase